MNLNLDLFQGPLGMAGGGSADNVCITGAGTWDDAGTQKWFYNYNIVGGGSSDPWETAGGTLFYSFESDDTGKYVLQWGDAGNEQLPDVANILITYQDTGVKVANWDDTEKYYTFTDLALFTSMKAEFDAGTTDFCMNLEILPSPFLVITYAELMRGV